MNKCIHKYTAGKGFADFLRGTIALYGLSKEFNYKLLIDDSHPIFNFLQESVHFTRSELTASINISNPAKAYEGLKLSFLKNQSFCIFTNSFYTKNSDQTMSNWGEIPQYARQFLNEILQPKEVVINKIDKIFNSFGWAKENFFEVIHIRSGDKLLLKKHNQISNQFTNHYINKIESIITKNTNIKYVLISDSTLVEDEIKNNLFNSNIIYTNSDKVHLGHKDLTEASVLSTLVDFFIMKFSRKIHMIGHDSGFSTIPSLLYGIDRHYYV